MVRPVPCRRRRLPWHAAAGGIPPCCAVARPSCRDSCQGAAAEVEQQFRVQASDVLAELRGVPFVPPGDRDTVFEAVGPCTVRTDGSAEVPDVLLLQGVPGLADKLA